MKKANPVDLKTLQHYLFWDAQHYTRNLVDKTELYELLTLCWEPGMKSSIHNHKGQNCWMAAPIGRLSVQNYSLRSEDLAAHRCDIVPTDEVHITWDNPVAVDPLNPVHDDQESAPVEQARRGKPPRVLASIRFLYRLFRGAMQLRRDRLAVHIEVREAVLEGGC